MGTLNTSNRESPREKMAAKLDSLVCEAHEAKQQGLSLVEILAQMETTRDHLNQLIGTHDTTEFEDRVFANSSEYLNRKEPEITPGMIRRGKSNRDSKRNFNNKDKFADRITPF